MSTVSSSVASSAKETLSFQFVTGPGLQITDALVVLYGLSGSESTKIGEYPVKGGSFSLSFNAPGYSRYYAVATLKGASLNGVPLALSDQTVQYLAVFNAIKATIGIGEQSTIAAAYCFARFITISTDNEILISGTARGLRIAYGMKNNFCLDTGACAEVIAKSPNGLETNSYPMFNFLSNLAWYCTTDKSVYTAFIAKSVSGTDGTFFRSLMAMIRAPFDAVEDIYNLIAAKPQPYSPSLPGLSLPPDVSPVPTQWTLSIKVNDSGASNFLIAGPAFAAFDKNDRVWITNNVTQGTPNSSAFCVVLEPDGRPAPFSPLFGGGLLGGGFGIVADAAGEKIYVGNFGWGTSDYNPYPGSISVFTADGWALSPSNGFTNQLNRVQGMAMDQQGNVWMCSWGNQEPMAPAGDPTYPHNNANSAIVVYLGGDPDKALVYAFDSPYYETFSVAIDSQGNGFVANRGYSKNGSVIVPSTLYKFSIDYNKNQLVVQAQWTATDPNHAPAMEMLKQVVVNSKDEVFVACAGSDQVIHFDNDLRVINNFTNKIYKPWGLTFDKNDVLYVGNFGKDGTDSADPRTIGIAILGPDEDESKIQLLQLPTGGDEVLLANGAPLYGNLNKPCYQPLMRLTSTAIDKAGNLWAFNNWKPLLPNDLLLNPGGDGYVIFVGMAEPQ